MPDPMGPYDTEAQALTAPMPQAVRALHATNRVRTGDPERLIQTTVYRALTAACNDAGVELGVFDRSTLADIADGEPSTAQVVIGLIHRAHQTGKEARGA